ncbi:LPXTG cell wall anchor domain-containing protein [Streptomyces goshikiensis]|uniref:LPXTG cell wall anchor domain-containing protein n=1 Tax=Streptomyces goshikiensis TaxID=1942 RepID=UPI0038028899
MGSSGSYPCAARLLRSPARPETLVVLPPRWLGALCLLLCGGGVCACDGQEVGEPPGCSGVPPAVGVGRKRGLGDVVDSFLVHGGRRTDGQGRTTHRQDGPRSLPRPRSRIPAARLRRQDACRGNHRFGRHPGVHGTSPPASYASRRSPPAARCSAPFPTRSSSSPPVTRRSWHSPTRTRWPASLSRSPTRPQAGPRWSHHQHRPEGRRGRQGRLHPHTGPDGTAMATLPVGKKTSSAYTATETKASDGYRLETTPVDIKAKLGAEITVSLTNTATTKPTEEPTGKPTAKPTGDPTAQPTPTSLPSASTGEPTATASSSSSPGIGTATSTPAAPDGKPEGSLAHTGADSANGWLLAVGGLLLAAGGGAVHAARRRKSDECLAGPGPPFRAPAACWWARTIVESTQTTDQSTSPIASECCWT